MAMSGSKLRIAVIALGTVVLLMVMAAGGRILLSPRAPDRDYRQELVDLSRSVVPETPESLENAQRLAQLLDEDAQRWRAIYAQQRENPEAWPVAIPDYRLVGPRSLAIRTHRPRQWIEAAYEFTRGLYATHVAEISPQLAWITSETPIAAIGTSEGSSPDLPDFADPNFMRLPYFCFLEIAHFANLLETGHIEAHASLDRIIGMIRATDQVVVAWGRLARFAYQSLLVEFLHDLIASDKFPADAAERTLRTLQKMRLQDPGWKHVIEGERLVSLSIVRVLFDRKQRHAFFQSKDPLPLFPALYTSEREVYEYVNAIYDEVQKVFDGRESQYLDAAYYSMVVGRTVRDRILQHAFPDYPHWLKKERQAQVILDIVCTMLALEAYRSEHSAYPSELADLIPSYLSELPADPLSPSGAPFRYRPLEPNHNEPVDLDYLLWSVGPNGIDNGGQLDAKSMVGGGNPAASTESVFLQIRNALRGSKWEGDIILNITPENLEATVEHARDIPLVRH